MNKYSNEGYVNQWSALLATASCLKSGCSGVS